MYSRLIKPPEAKSFFLFGPRGTGKTTWVLSAFPQARYIDLLEAEIFNDLLANPQRLERMIPHEFSGWVVVDEIQKVPALLDEVHRLIERDKRRFILTGSSPRKLRQKGRNLLAGRALSRALYPLTAPELGGDFDLRHSLRFGSLPCVYTESDPKSYLESYVKTYLEEEVRQEGLTRNLAAFARFLEAASFAQGSVLNLSHIARECAVERKTVENYFGILEDLLIARRLPVFTRRAKRRLIAHSKFYFSDPGVFRTIRPAGPLDSPEEAEGPALETLFLAELTALNDYLGLGYVIHYWRTSNDTEVDFVLYGPRGLKAFEIKRTARFDDRQLSGLKAFRKDFPIAKTFLIYGGEKSFNEDGIQILPFADILPRLATIL